MVKCRLSLQLSCYFLINKIKFPRHKWELVRFNCILIFGCLKISLTNLFIVSIRCSSRLACVMQHWEQLNLLTGANDSRPPAHLRCVSTALEHRCQQLCGFHWLVYKKWDVVFNVIDWLSFVLGGLRCWSQISAEFIRCDHTEMQYWTEVRSMLTQRSSCQVLWKLLCWMWIPLLGAR